MPILILKFSMTLYQIQNKVPTLLASSQNPPDLAPSYIFNPFSFYTIRYRHNDPHANLKKNVQKHTSQAILCR